MPALEKEFGIGGRGSLEGIGAVQAYDRAFRNQFHQRSRGTVKNQRLHAFRKRGDMIAARDPESFAEKLFIQKPFVPSLAEDYPPFFSCA